MDERNINERDSREVVVDVLAATLYEMLTTGWYAPLATSSRRPGPRGVPAPRPISGHVNQRRPGR